MTKRVLSIGQCVPDHMAIVRLVEGNFDATIEQGHVREDSLAALRNGAFDLVLINRKLDRDYTDGVDILLEIKQDPALRHLPVMLITNYADQQELAVAAGAARGFGKKEYGLPETLEKLRQFLGNKT